MKKGLRFKYPKLMMLSVSMFLAYVLFKLHFFQAAASLLDFHGYMSVFIAGLLFSYGFTTPFAVGFFLTVGTQVNPFWGALVGATGALVSDLLIFEWIRSEFQDEFDRLKLTWFFRQIGLLFHRHVRDSLKPYLLWTVGGFIIASPLPDELGVSLISGFTDIDERVFACVSFLFNALGILVMLSLA